MYSHGAWSFLVAYCHGVSILMIMLLKASTVCTIARGVVLFSYVSSW